MQSLASGADDAARLAARLGIALHKIDVHRFPDGELRVRVGPAAPTTILYVPLDEPNEKLLTILFAAEALRRGGAQRLVLVSPYLCYMRQDKAFHEGEAISQKVIGNLLARTVERIVTVEAHLHRTPDIRAVFPGIEADDLSATPAIAEALDRIDRRTVLVGPDEESEAWVRDLSARLTLDYVVGRKRRANDRSVDIAFTNPAQFKERPVLLIDDIVSSGGTLMVCARALKAAGAGPIDAVVTHALFPPAMMHDFTRAGLHSLRSTTSVPHPSNAIMLDAILADALRKEISA